MLSKIYSSAILGVDAYIVDVEVDIFNGLPGISMVGLPDTAVQESRERVRSAIKNSDLQFPVKRMTINLAPANTKKSGPIFDLAIALGILSASEQITPININNFVIAGELSLDGSIRSVQGILPFALAAKEAGKKAMIVPIQNEAEAAMVKELDIYGVQNLKEAIKVLSAPKSIPPFKNPVKTKHKEIVSFDFSDVKGQSYAKRGLEIAAAGGHNVIMVGPPGSGKTMLAHRVAEILPPLTFAEALETSKIYSISHPKGLTEGLIHQRPFRSPHHSVSNAGLIGGSRCPKPGEISLAHHGILFLDELLEFKRQVLEVLRQPLESGSITISRANTSLTYPAGFMLIAAMNPCPCGHHGDTKKVCKCSAVKIERYWNKLSGPFLDRIDIHLEVPRLSKDEIISSQPSEKSESIRKRVVEARKRQQKRLSKRKLLSNSQMRPADIREYCSLNSTSKTLLISAIERLNLSARAYDRILKVARTIADLSGSKAIQLPHIAEAIQFRNLDRTLK